MTSTTLQPRGIVPTGVECFFGEDEILVSKTDTKGLITYANRVFRRVAGYTEAELLGEPHNVIRHPDMPRCVFQLLWDTIQAGREVFAYVVNLAKNGDHYWVLAHVTPTFDEEHRVVGYHSNRRRPSREAVSRVEGLYRELRQKELEFERRQEGIAAGTAMLVDSLAEAGMEYDEFVFSLRG